METLRRTLHTPSSRIAAVVLLVVVVLIATGSALAPHGALAQDTNALLKGPSGHHLLGTDYLGRDTLSRLIAGTRATVLSALAMVAIGLLAGGLPGILSAFLGRTAEFVAMRTVDALLTLPTIILAIAIAGFFSNGPWSAIIAVGVLLAPRFFRIARAETLGFASQQYVEAAELLGASRGWLIRTHIWRKVLPTIVVTAAVSAGYAVLATSSLSFLGLGVQPPAPTWGSMLSADVQHLSQDSVGPIWPGIAIALTVWSFNAIADGLRDALGARADVHARSGSQQVPAHELESLLVNEEEVHHVA